jgi:hypothetical protein
MGDPVDPLLSPAYHLHFHESQNDLYLYKNTSPGPSSPSHTTRRNSPVQDIFHHIHDNDPGIGPDPNVDEEPLYVNAKQYFRILKRRVARARLEEVHRLSRQRKVRLSFHLMSPLIPPLPSLISMNLATSMRCAVPVAQVVASSPPKKSPPRNSLSSLPPTKIPLPFSSTPQTLCPIQITSLPSHASLSSRRTASSPHRTQTQLVCQPLPTPLLLRYPLPLPPRFPIAAQVPLPTSPLPSPRSPPALSCQVNSMRQKPPQMFYALPIHKRRCITSPTPMPILDSGTLT